jgi:hypothetical protein
MFCHMFSMLFPKFPYPFFHVVPNCPTFSPMFLAQSPTHLAYIYVGNMEKLDQFYLETPMRVSKVGSILCRPINKSHYQPKTFLFNFWGICNFCMVQELNWASLKKPFELRGFWIPNQPLGKMDIGIGHVCYTRLKLGVSLLLLCKKTTEEKKSPSFLWKWKPTVQSKDWKRWLD